jgi:hypothetical protein
MSNTTCPLCDGLAKVKPSEFIDGQVVWCERCKHFKMEYDALTGFEEQRHLIAGLTRRASMPLTLTHKNIPELLKASGVPRDLLDQLDIALEYSKEHQKRGDQCVEYRDLTVNDYPVVFARDQGEFLHLFLMLVEQQFLEEPVGRDPARRTSFRITAKGWQRLRELAKTGKDPNRAFVAMSFAPELLSAWINGIKLALEDLGFSPIRIDQTHGEDKIDDRIVAEIRRSGLLVADFTGHRGGVYFEAGFAMGLGIPVVWTCKKSDVEAAHFDTRQQQHLLWETPEDLRAKLVNHIAARIPGRLLP